MGICAAHWKASEVPKPEIRLWVFERSMVIVGEDWWRPRRGAGGGRAVVRAVKERMGRRRYESMMGELACCFGIYYVRRQVVMESKMLQAELGCVPLSISYISIIMADVLATGRGIYPDCQAFFMLVLVVEPFG